MIDNVASEKEIMRERDNEEEKERAIMRRRMREREERKNRIGKRDVIPVTTK